MTLPCPGPRAATSRPSWRAPPGAAGRRRAPPGAAGRRRAPPGATDCHRHVFGPYNRYPLSLGRPYTPPDASAAAYRDVLDTIGLSRTVVVQPSVHGADDAATLGAAEAIGLGRARAVVAVDDGSGAAELADIAARGGRGVRFNAVSGDVAPLAQPERLAGRIAPLGRHVQIYTHSRRAAGVVAGAAPPARAGGGGPHGRREGRGGRCWWTTRRGSTASRGGRLARRAGGPHCGRDGA